MVSLMIVGLAGLLSVPVDEVPERVEALQKELGEPAYSADGKAIEAALNWIKSIASEPEVGQIYTGKVVKIVDFGAFVNFFGAKDGLVHVSQISSERVNKVSDVLQEGQSVKVKLLGFDDRGKTRLSMKVVDQETGEDLSSKSEAKEEA